MNRTVICMTRPDEIDKEGSSLVFLLPARYGNGSCLSWYLDVVVETRRDPMALEERVVIE